MDKIGHQYRALLVGCGKMGGALLRQWVVSDAIEYTVVDPVGHRLPSRANVHTNIKALGEQTFDMIIIAIKPQLIDSILPYYAKHLSTGGVVLSMAAGCSIERLSTVLQTKSVIRIMPNLPSFIGRGVTGIYATSFVSLAYRKLAEDMMNLAGSCVWVDSENGIDRITAVSGSGPGYVFEFARAYIEAAKTLGFSEEQSRDLVLSTIAGTIEMAKQSNESLETLRKNVTSKHGTTEAGLSALNGDGQLTVTLKNTVSAAYQRAFELQ